MLPLLFLIPLLPLTKAVPQAATSDCVGTISSLEDVSNAVQCMTVNINSFTVPAGTTFSLNLQKGATVNVLGDIKFGASSWGGPLFEVTGEDIYFNGNSYTWDGNGPYYWDGLGNKGSASKPQPVMSIGITGSISNVKVVDCPARCIAINDGPVTVSYFTIDNSLGNLPNDRSNGLPAGRNTDGFDVAANDVLIEKSTVINQDDCVAINRGKNIEFRDNWCEDGHGISIGSISSHTTVDNVTINGNTVVNSQQAFRIKTDQDAIDSSVTNVLYSNNIAKNCTEFGLIFTQSYPSAVGTPGNGVIVSNVQFRAGTTSVEVVEEADTITIDCGSDTCRDWDMTELKVSGGKLGLIKNKPDIIGMDL